MTEKTTTKFPLKHPYLQDTLNQYLLTTREKFNTYKDDNKIEIESIDTDGYGEVEYVGVSVTLLKDILSNPEYYEYAMRVFDDELDGFYISYLSYGEIKDSHKIKKMDIIKGLDHLINFNLLELTALERERYTYLKSKVDYDRFLKEYLNTEYTLDIDGTSYTFSVDELIDFIGLPYLEFKRICDSKDIKTIRGVKKEYFFYALKRFFEDNKIFENYSIPRLLFMRYIDIHSSKKVDIQAINKLLQSHAPSLLRVKVNDELKRHLLDDMPEELSPIEKSIYIYIKMCITFTYDEEFYVVDKNSSAIEPHKKIEHIEEITPSNNKIVCYEFNAIFGSILKYLGINFRMNEQSERDYGDGHAYLIYRYEEFLVKADSVMLLLDNDLTNAKLKRPLSGLKCLNINTQTKEEFQSLVSKIYDLVLSQEQSKKNTRIKNTDDFEKTLSDYRSITGNYRKVRLSDRLDILINKVKTIDMETIDTITYLFQCINVMFDGEEQEKNFSAVIIRNNEDHSGNKVASASVIIAINERGFEYHDENNLYYLLNPAGDLVPMTKSELQKKFDDGAYEYINNTNVSRIPGIKGSRLI